MTTTKNMRKFFSAALAVIVVFTGLKLFPENVSAGVPYVLSGVAHVQDQGDTPGTFDPATGELVLGTEGLSRRLESITINFENNTGYEGTIEYQAHVQEIGWMDWVSAGSSAGTIGEGKGIEAVSMRLTGELANYYTISYAATIEEYGDLQGWVGSEEVAGTTGESKGITLLRVKLVPIENPDPAPETEADTVVTSDVISDEPGSPDMGPIATGKINYKSHVQDYGWETDWKKDGATSGSTGQAKKLEGIYIDYVGTDYSGGIKYCTHVQDIGWQDWVTDGQLSGTTGQNKRLEGIKIELTGDVANYYDVYYRVHCENYGWLGWAKNGEFAGTEGQGLRLEAIQIVLVAKNGGAPGNINGATSAITAPAPGAETKLNYKTHIQDYGWESGWKKDGESSGTIGQAKKLESIYIDYVGTEYSGGVTYSTHVQDIGWQDYVSDGQLSGTTGQNKRLEGIKIALTGDVANYYDIYYRVHCEDYGWLGWAKDGEFAGTEGMGLRLEAIQIVLVKKGGSAPGNINGATSVISTPTPGSQTKLKYKTHVQDYGWESVWSADGETSGTMGKSKKLESIYLDYIGTEYSGGIRYCTHVQDVGWQDWVTDGQLSGTTGQNKRLEGIKIELTGEVANYYDVYYRVHCEEYGWRGWSKNGEFAGTEGYGLRLEAIQVILVAKGGSAPGNINGATSTTTKTCLKKIKICLDAGHIGKYNQSPSVPAFYESDFTWKFHLYLKEELEKYGFVVVLTRGDQYESLGVYERGLAAAGCDLFISIHADASSNTKINNPSAYCAINGSADTIGLQLAQIVAKDMGTSSAKLYHRVGENGDYYGVLRGATAVGVPAVMLETSFYTCPNSAKWLLNDANLKKLAQDEALAIAQYYGLA